METQWLSSIDAKDLKEAKLCRGGISIERRSQAAGNWLYHTVASEMLSWAGDTQAREKVWAIEI